MQEPSLLFLNMGGFEILFILFMVLMFFGSKSIPTFARGLGRGIRQVRDAANDIKEDILDSANNVDEQIKSHTKEIEEPFKDIGKDA